MKVALDMDEVLVEFVDGLLEVWNKEHNTSIRYGDVKSWQLDETFGAGTYPEICEVLSRPSFFVDLEPKPLALEGARALLKAGHQVVVATHIDEHVGEWAYAGKRSWLSKHLPELEQRDLFFVSRKSWIDADFLVDDAVHNVQEWAAVRPGAILFDAPWNQACAGRTRHPIVRAEDWGDVLDFILIPNQIRRGG